MPKIHLLIYSFIYELKSVKNGEKSKRQKDIGHNDLSKSEKSEIVRKEGEKRELSSKMNE